MMVNQKLRIELELGKNDIINLVNELENSNPFLTTFIYKVLGAAHQTALNLGDAGKEMDSINPLSVWNTEG